jgi:hypothetical protein
VGLPDRTRLQGGPASLGEGDEAEGPRGRYGLDMMVGKDEPTLEEVQAFLDSKDAKKVEEVKEVEAFFS